MRRENKTTLGISPGTRHMGIAVVYDGSLSRHQVLTFPGAWSGRKLRAIQKTVIRLIEKYGVNRIVVKIPDTLPNTKAYTQVIGSLNRIAESAGVRVRYHTLSELKRAYARTEDISRASLMERAVKLYPDLSREYRKERRNKEGYYYKLFEAVLAADMPRARQKNI